MSFEGNDFASILAIIHSLISGPDLPVPLREHCLAQRGNKFYVIGGNSGGTKLDTVYIYDFSTYPSATYETGPALNLGRISHGCATLDDGTIVVAGGDSGSGRTNTVEILLDGSSSWVSSKSILQVG